MVQFLSKSIYARNQKYILETGKKGRKSWSHDCGMLQMTVNVNQLSSIQNVISYFLEGPSQCQTVAKQLVIKQRVPVSNHSTDR